MCRLGTGRADWARGCMILYLRPHGIICETLQRSAAKRSARTTTSHMWLTPAGQTSAQGARKGNTTLRGDTEAWASEVAEPRYSKMLLACAVQDCQRKTVWYSLDHRGEPTCQTIPPPSISSEYDYATTDSVQTRGLAQAQCIAVPDLSTMFAGLGSCECARPCTSMARRRARSTREATT